MPKCSKCGELYSGAEVFCPQDGTRLEAEGTEEQERKDEDGDTLVGSTVQGRYKIIGKLGEGGMGVVYIAEHIEIEKKFALKVLRENFSKKPEVVERFRQEARSASRIGHPNIVDVTDFGQLNDGGVYFVMEYLQGKSLSDVIKKEDLPLERVASIIRQIAKALKEAHAKGIVHRDLKPENIFLVKREENEDFVKILDFGIAKISDRDSEGKRLTRTGVIFGTPEYMSPEQAAGRNLDQRVDIYALGCIMFEMFTRRVPFQGESFMAVLTQHMFEPTPKIETIDPDTKVPVSVRSVIYKAMAKNQEDRYEDMEALEIDLEHALKDESYQAEYSENTTSLLTGKREGGEKKNTQIDWTPSSVADLGRQRRRKSLVVAAAVVGVIVVAAVVFTVLKRGSENEATRVLLPVETVGIENQTREVEPQQKGVDVKPDENAGAKPNIADAGKTQEPAAVEGEAQAKAEEERSIEVSIQTVPQGALILVENMGQVCLRSPCQVKLEAGKPVEVKAELDGRKSSMTFTPSVQNKEIILSLDEAPKKTARKRTGEPAKRTERVESSPTREKAELKGLKIPGIFKEN